MPLELPSVVRTCKDDALRNRAIALFADPKCNKEERAEAVRDIILAGKGEREEDRIKHNREREAQWRAWLSRHWSA